MHVTAFDRREAGNSVSTCEQTRVRCPAGGPEDWGGAAHAGGMQAAAETRRRMPTRRLAWLWIVLSAMVGSLQSATALEANAGDKTATPGAAVRPAASKPEAVTKGTVPKSSSEKKKQSQAETDFVRLRSDDKEQPVALETAVTHYVITAGPYQGARVDLIGAVHIGEKSYYAQLNKLFTTYDAVLYELVAPENARVPRPNGQPKNKHVITILQTAMKDVLELQFQLEQIDYAKPNMVHADMSPAEFTKSMRNRGESFFKMFVRALGQSTRMQLQGNDTPSEMELLVALFSRDRALKLKQILAKQFRDVEAQTAGMFGPNGSTIITERNKKALQVLRRELKHGKRHLAIFYGAGHLLDMESRLVHDFSAKKTGQQWLVAWSLQ